MKRKGKIWFFLVTILILVLTYTAFFGVSSRYGDVVTPIVKSASDIRFGIDIRGGVDVSFVPQTEVQATQVQMDAAQAVIENRLVGLGINDYELYKDVDKSRIILRFPWKENETNFNPEEAIQELATAAVLTFREGNEVDAAGLPTGVTAENIILQGDDVVNAESQFRVNEYTQQTEYFVELTLSDAGREKFAEATSRLAGVGSISIWMDNTRISAPTVDEAINTNSAIISGPSFTAESSKDLADTINAGSLPFALTAESYSTISPTLGSQALRATVLAGIVAFILVALFMIFNYRLPGVVSVISLLGQVTMTIAVVSGYFVVFDSNTLTLPGIAGIVLAIGMGVDANVITAERIKEELRGGKKLDAALKAGFSRGVAPIIDGNVTVLIVAAILMGAFGTPDSLFGTIFRPVFFFFGPSTSGTIYSFGFTLMTGVLLNFVFGVGCNRVLLTSLSKFKRLRSGVLYGGLKAGQIAPVVKPYGVVKNRVKFFAVSGALLVVIMALGFPLAKLDVQFSGGAIVSYAYEGGIELTEVEAISAEVLQGDATVQTGENAATGSKTLTFTLAGSQTIDVETLDALTAALNEQYPQGGFQQLEVNNVNPTIGGAFLWKCVVAMILASVLILAYVAFRFRKIGGWRGGLTAVVALVHDLIIVYGVFVIFGIPLSGNFIAALLTILGYSINDTVVIYDRIRENRTLHGRRMPFGDLVNLSINQSLNRTINTSLTTLLALASITIFAFVYGLQSVYTFTFPLMIGMVSGVYSSLCIATPLWALWETRAAKKTKAAKGKKKAADA